jgi:PAS domain S-box-containing protein
MFPRLGSDQVHRLVIQLHNLQRNPFAVLGVAIGAILIATLIRWALGIYVHERIPFTTYYPAIVVATLLGGFWLGSLASVLSGILAWWLFMPPTFGFSFDGGQISSVLAFLLVCILLVGAVAALNAAVDLLVVEIDNRRKAQLALQQLETVAETSEDAIITKDLNGIITSWNEGAERIFGYSADEVIGKSISLLIPADRPDEEPAILERLRKGQRIKHYETVRQRKDGTLIDISLSVSPLADATGRIVGASKIARDITERSRAATRQEMLVREMSHRVKNAFTVVNGILAMSARYVKPESLVHDMQDRLAALARAHDLTRPGLLSLDINQERPTTIRALINSIFAPYLDTQGKRLSVNGPDVQIKEQSFTALALVLYELATNAVKYGSLSVPTGTIQIDWMVAHAKLNFAWKERGGPKVIETPSRDGFGTSLVRRIVVDQFGGEVFYHWDSDGLIVRLVTPLERVLNGDEEPRRGSPLELVGTQ